MGVLDGISLRRTPFDATSFHLERFPSNPSLRNPKVGAMSQVACLSCSDSPLSVAANIVGIATFAYTLALGTLLFGIQLNGSTAEIKRFGKSIAFLQPRISQLRHTFLSREIQATNEAAIILRQTRASTANAPNTKSYKDFEARLTSLVKDFESLWKDAKYLWRTVTDTHFNVTIWKRMWWLWNQVDARVRVAETEARFVELLHYAEKQSVQMLLSFYTYLVHYLTQDTAQPRLL